jgi:hypothetical protein
MKQRTHTLGSVIKNSLPFTELEYYFFLRRSVTGNYPESVAYSLVQMLTPYFKRS